MSEAVRTLRMRSWGLLEQLLAFYADGSDAAIAGATKLTLGHDRGNRRVVRWARATHGHPRPQRRSGALGCRCISAALALSWMLEDFDQRWAAAFAKAKAELLVAQVAARATEIAEALPAEGPKAED